MERKIEIDSSVLPDYKCLKCNDTGKIWDAEHECFEPCFMCISLDDASPRTKFCWHCGRQLRANFFREYQNPEDGHTYTVHAQCYGQLETGLPPVRSEDEDESGS